MNPASPPLQNDLHDLPQLVVATIERRNQLCAEISSVRQEEVSQRQRLQHFTADSRQGLPFLHPLWASLSEHAAVLEQFTASQEKMLEKRGEILQGRERQAPINETIKNQIGEIQRLTAALKKAQIVGWILMPVVLGYFILKKATLIKPLIETAEHHAAGAQEKLDVEMSHEAGFLAELTASQTAAKGFYKKITLAAETLTEQRLASEASSWNAIWAAVPPMLRGDWSEGAWAAHDFKLNARLSYLVAAIAEQPNGRIIYPRFVPFIGRGRTVLITGARAPSLSLLHALIMQMATAMPYGATFTLLDPASAGRAFPMQRGLPHTRKVGTDAYRDLEAVQADIRRIIESYIDDKTHSFEELPENVQANERYEIIVAANFPDGYDRRSIELLQSIAKNGPVAGKYVFLHHDPKVELPRDLSWNGFGPVWECSLTGLPEEWALEGSQIEPLAGPQDGAMSRILDLLGAAKPPETKVKWEDLVPKKDQWWSEDASNLVSVAVGSSGRARNLTVWFGAERDGRACSHGMVAGTTGSGKSILYHALITGLSVRYSPEELDLYLIDLKEGTEFQFYRNLPHARVVALNSDPELSRSVLRDLKAEMDRRTDLFKQHGVSSLADYRAKRSPGGIVPRSLLLVDEYQRLFEEDRAGEASALLMQIAQQGRSAGLHLLVGSQRFGAAGMLNQGAIFGNMHLRIALKMTLSDVQGLTEFGRNGKRLIEGCDQPGKAVVNDQAGAEDSNEFGKVAYMDKETQITPTVLALIEKAEHEIPAERRFATVVFDGKRQPNLCENPQMMDIIRLPHRPDEEGWRKIAAAPAHRQGLGIMDWFRGERPLCLWLGQELNVHGQAKVILRRRQSENVLLVGDNQMAICGVMTSILVSVAVMEPSSAARVWVMDRAVPGTPWHKTLESTVANFLRPLGYECVSSFDTKEVSTWIVEWVVELERRATLDEDVLMVQPTWLMLVSNADRLTSLARVSGRIGTLSDSPDGALLKQLLAKGPVLGLHVVLSFPTSTALKQSFERGQLELFKHRIATQMGDADSFFVFERDIASKLQKVAARPIFAIYRDTSSGVDIKFKPYTVDAEIPWHDQFGKIQHHLQR